MIDRVPLTEHSRPACEPETSAAHDRRMGRPATKASAAETETRTVCPYCGVGCGLVAKTEGGRLRSVEGDPIY
ncbi:MAG: hypothetical protein ACR2J6_03590, partial [Thermoleophilaceae bacterium]